MDKDNEIELIQTIQEKDKKIKELEAMNENITRELLSRTDELNELLEKFAQNAMESNRNTSVSTKDATKFIKDMHKNTTKYHNKIGKELIKGIEEGLKEGK